MKPSHETLASSFRKFLTEDTSIHEENAINPENNFAVIKSGEGLSVNYVLFDAAALKQLCALVKDENQIHGKEINISREQLITKKVVVSIVKIAENTPAMKSNYGTCMDAAHIKLSAVNKNMTGNGYGKMLYKIVMTDHPEGLIPDRDYVSEPALKAWKQMVPSLTAKSVFDASTGKTHDSLDNINNPKTPTKDDDCVLHTQEGSTDLNVLDKAYIYLSADTDSFLNKGKQALIDCEKILPEIDPETLSYMLEDAGLALYAVASEYSGPINETRLSKYWRRKGKERARRNERQYGNLDRAWAIKQQEAWNKSEPDLEKGYLEEIEHAKKLASTTKEYLLKIKEIRANRKLSKKQNVKEALPSLYSNKVTKKFPYSKERTDGGVAAVYQKRSKKAKGATAAPGESFGPLEESDASGIIAHNVKMLTDAQIDTVASSKQIPMTFAKRLYSRRSDALPVEEYVKNIPILTTNKIVRPIKVGSIGFVYQLDNDYVIKLSIGGEFQAISDKEWYKKVLDAAHSGKSSKLSPHVLDYGTFDKITWVVMNFLIVLPEYFVNTGRKNFTIDNGYEGNGLEGAVSEIEWLISGEPTPAREIARGLKEKGYIGPNALTIKEFASLYKTIKHGVKNHLTGDLHPYNIGVMPQSTPENPVFVIFDK